jgi:hypothetical protein
MSLSAGVVHAAPLPSRPILTLEAARTVVGAAEAKAKAEGVTGPPTRQAPPFSLAAQYQIAALPGADPVAATADRIAPVRAARGRRPKRRWKARLKAPSDL